MAKQKSEAALEKDAMLHYEIGVNSAWRGETVDDMPKYKKAVRRAAWLRGFNDGKQAQQAHRERSQIDKDGLKTLASFMREALAGLPTP